MGPHSTLRAPRDRRHEPRALDLKLTGQPYPCQLPPVAEHGPTAFRQQKAQGSVGRAVNLLPASARSEDGGASLASAQQ